MNVWPWFLCVLCLASACGDSGDAKARAIAGNEAQREERAEAYLRATLRAAEGWLEVVRATSVFDSVATPQPCSHGGTMTLGSSDAVLFTFDVCQLRADAPPLTGVVRAGPDGQGGLKLQPVQLTLGSAEGPVSLEGTMTIQKSRVSPELVLNGSTTLTRRKGAHRTELRAFTLVLRNVGVGTELSMTGDVEDSRLGQSWFVSTPDSVGAVEGDPGSAPQAHEGALDLRFGDAARLRVQFDDASVEALWDLDANGELEDGPYSLPLEVREAPGLFWPWEQLMEAGDGDGEG